MSKASKEELYDMISTVAAGEKFKQDAYFFCGFPSESPDEELLKASEAYLRSVDEDRESEEIRSDLIRALENAAARKRMLADKDNMTSNADEIRTILGSRENL